MKGGSDKSLNEKKMHFVILNHTTENPRFLMFDNGTLAGFADSKWANLSGAAEMGLETGITGYQVVTQTPPQLVKKLGKICPDCLRISHTTDQKTGLHTCDWCKNMF